MRKLLLVLLGIYLVTASPAYTGNLYLLKIDNHESLDVVKNHIKHAHGMIDKKFIVMVDDITANQLESSGVNLILLEQNCILDNLYLVNTEFSKYSKTALHLNAIHSITNNHLIHLEPGSVDILLKEKYKVFPLTDKQTPLFYRPPIHPAMLLADYPTDTLADMVNQDSLYNYDIRLVDFRTRYFASDSIIKARNWIYGKFTEFGYINVDYDEFLVTSSGYDNVPCNNVICIKPGSEMPDKYILVGGHYDSYNGDSDPMVYAPGADDNASGTVSVLELARVLSDYNNKKSIMFVAFSAEELGLFGSEYIAQGMYEDGIDLELMVNLDMVAFNEDGLWEGEMDQHYCEPYLDVFISTMERVSSLTYVNGTSGSDHLSFVDYGFNSIHMQENNFNYGGWHTDLDIPSRLDFAYLEQMVRALTASIAIVDQSPSPPVFGVFDIGDGQSLRISWEDCWGDYTYKIIYGIDEENLSDTVDVPPSSCYYDLTGLTEGQTYYIGLIGIPNDGMPPIGVNIENGIPLGIPRVPSGVTAETDSGAVLITWQANKELDISHYKLLRKIPGYSWTILADNLTDTALIDTEAEKYTDNFYTLIALDQDQNESDSSEIVKATPATFDAGILLVDETQSGGINPSESEQIAFYSNMFDTIGYVREKIDSSDEALTKSLAGQYNPIFWVDDDDYNHVIGNSLDSLEWYFGYDTDFLLAGWSTIYSQTGQTYFYPGNFYYDELGISYIAENPLTDFTGATGLDDWPDLELKPEAPGGGRMPKIDRFAVTSEAEVIYSFNSYSGNPAYDGKPVGVAIDTYHGKRIVLGFPLYWMTEASARALIARVMTYFAEESVLPGDVNGDWSINILDVTSLIGYLYQEGEPPVDMNNGDPNGDCTINILDITYLISYLYKGGLAPFEGCVR